MSDKTIELPVYIEFRTDGAALWSVRISHLRVSPSAIAYVCDPDWHRPRVWHDNPRVEKIERELVLIGENDKQVYRVASYIRLVTGEVFVSSRTNEEINSMLEDAG